MAFLLGALEGISILAWQVLYVYPQYLQTIVQYKDALSWLIWVLHVGTIGKVAWRGDGGK